MAQGRGSAHGATVVFAAVLLCLLVHIEIAHAVIYTVGDSGGWTFNVINWPRGKSFRAGDVLVFKYSPAIHNLVTVNSIGYNGCTTPRGSKVFTSGNDRITLARGQSFFICSVPGHCSGGMKIAVNAA
ncbi:basic blue protein-like [Tasmannia lanceolata]|uniref:basic blue protein-like n=1 Tax=Tasmannia lanceolata TaxID=3420 RepID=UPI004063BF7E